MFQEYYGLRKDPFSLNPDLGFLYQSNVHEEAIAHLVYGLEQKEDIISIAGDIGTGKTLAIHRLFDQISGSVLPVLINVTTISFEEFVHFVLLKLDVEPEVGMPVAGLLHRLERKLVEMREQGRSVLLIIDEAQNLSVESLESVRLLLNLAQPGGQVLQIVLTGQLGLRDKLELPEMRQLRQRIKVSYTFGTLNRLEMEEYIQHRLAKAGREKPLFKREALDRIFEESNGVPRVVNYLASKALLAGYVDRSSTITRRQADDAVGESKGLLAGSGGASDSAEPKPAPRLQPEPQAASQPAPQPELQPELELVEERLREILAEPTPAPRQQEPPRVRSGRRIGGVVVAVLLVTLVAVAAVWTYPEWGKRLFGESRENPVEARGQAAEPTVPPSARPARTADDRNSGSAEPLTREVDSADEIANPAAQDMALSAPSAPPGAAESDSFAAHVASFRELERADRFSSRLRNLGWPSQYQKYTVSDERTWYRVYLGPFAERGEADVAVAELKATDTIQYSRIVHR